MAGFGTAQHYENYEVSTNIETFQGDCDLGELESDLNDLNKSIKLIQSQVEEDPKRLVYPNTLCPEGSEKCIETKYTVYLQVKLKIHGQKKAVVEIAMQKTKFIKKTVQTNGTNHFTKMT